LGVTANQKGIELILDFQNPSAHLVVGDVGRMRQILTNLVGNAIKFTESGYVLLKIQTAQIGEKLDVTMSITDTGIGISEEALEHIFDEFTQADGSTTRLFGGTGLGLSITKSLVETMKGDIKAQSILGEGTTITIELNLDTAKVNNQLADQPPDGPDVALCSNSRVLIVDDIDQNLKVLDAMLDKLDVQPDMVSSAKDAVLKLKEMAIKKSHYDLLITDYQMPEIDGFKLVSAIRASGNFTPIAKVKKRVLVAEDDKTNQIVIKMMLETLEYDFDVVANGAVACKLYQERLYDLVLMDISMPVMGGVEALIKIRAFENGKRHTPIIAVTAHALKHEKEKFLEAGFDGYLPKPITKTDLENIIAQCLSA